MELEAGWAAETAGVEPAPRPPVAWEDPGVSVLVGFCRTLRDLLFHPEEFFANLGREGWAAPLTFALIVASAGMLCSLFWHLLVLAPRDQGLGDAVGLAASLGLDPAWLMVLMAGAPLLVLFDLAVGGLCWWGSVALVGADREFTPSWRIFGYAHAGMALGVIPFFGMLVAAIWILVLLYYGVKQVYGVSAWRAQGTLAIFLSLQALLMLLLLLGLAATLAFLGFLLLLS